MVEFVDGPAKGTKLMLHRAPLYLRAVSPPGDGWDALDQLDDEPLPREAVTVYKRRDDLQQPTRFHIRTSGGRGTTPSGCYMSAKYSVVDPQPMENETRTTAAWQRWVTAQVKA